MKAVLDDLAPLQDPGTLWSAADTALVPVMLFKLQVKDLGFRCSRSSRPSAPPRTSPRTNSGSETFVPGGCGDRSFFRGSATPPND